MVNNSNSVADSFKTELTEERKLTSALRTESAAWRTAYGTALHVIDLHEQKDKARSRKAFWRRFVPKLGAGAVVTQDGIGPAIGLFLGEIVDCPQLVPN